MLDKGPHILDRLLKYDGCEEFIRKVGDSARCIPLVRLSLFFQAITTPGAETEDAAWKAVLPAVDQLQEFYDFSLELEACFPKLLVALCRNDPKDSLANQQALAKQLADVFDFVLRFDDAKVCSCTWRLVFL